MAESRRNRCECTYHLSDFLINAQVEVLCVTRPSRDLSIGGVATQVPIYLYRSLVVGGVSLTSAPSGRCVNEIGGGGES